MHPVTLLLLYKVAWLGVVMFHMSRGRLNLQDEVEWVVWSVEVWRFSASLQVLCLISMLVILDQSFGMSWAHTESLKVNCKKERATVWELRAVSDLGLITLAGNCKNHSLRAPFGLTIVGSCKMSCCATFEVEKANVNWSLLSQVPCVDACVIHKNFPSQP